MGLQAAQVAHAAFQLSLSHPELVRQWHDDGSNSVVVLTVPNEDDLLDEMDHLVEAGVAYAYMVEPDIGDQHTAVAVGPSAHGRRFANRPLMGKGTA